MLRFVVVAFEILALILVLRSAFVQFWLSDMQMSTSQWMNNVSMTIDNQQLSDFRNGILAQVKDLTEQQTVYLHRITSTKIELKNFDQHYCRLGDKNPFIFGSNLNLVCGEIGRKGILKNFS